MGSSRRIFSYRPELKHLPGQTPSEFPLSVSANGRYLVNGSGAPHRIQSEFLWAVMTTCTLAQVDAHIANRQARNAAIGTTGWNAIEIWGVVADQFTFTNVNGDDPFPGGSSSSANLGAPNADYFDFHDQILQRYYAAGWTVFYHPAYAADWSTALVANSDANIDAYGDFLGARLASFPNVILMRGGDTGMGNNTRTAKQNRLIDRINTAQGRYALCGEEWNETQTLVFDDTGLTADPYVVGTNPATSDMQLDTIYGLGEQGNAPMVYPTCDRAWSVASPIVPTIAMEMMQMDGSYSHGQSSRSQVRSYQYTAAIAGGWAGSNMGQTEFANGVGDQFSHIDASCYDDQDQFHKFAQSLKWWLMRPSGDTTHSPHGISGATGCTDYCGRVLVVSGQQTGTSLITACMSSDGTQIVAYQPPNGSGAKTFSLDLRSMAGTAAYAWIDPTTGDETAIASYPNSDSARSFTTPGNNASGTNDWILVGRT